MNLVEALDDVNLFGGLIRDPATFAAWKAFLVCLFGGARPSHRNSMYGAL
jgi:hypothetical protein